MDDKGYLYWLFQVPEIGAATMRKLWKEYGSFQEIYNIEGRELSGQKLLNQRQAERFDERKSYLGQTEEEYYNLSRRGIRFITVLDDDYPQRLRGIDDYPMGLYVKGNLPMEDQPTAAIIGARNCSHYGTQVAEYMGSALSSGGIQIISGLAAGIDGAGHRGALREHKSTYGVLGCGVNICYPKENYELYREMERTGGIISEYGLTAPPSPQHFPMRNRLISGFSDVILVVEAKEKSGSLITVEFGLEQGKEIYAVPGPITDQLSRGCNRLIKAGAAILTAPEDILEYFQIKNERILRVHEKNPNSLAKNEKMLYSCLDLRPKFIDKLVMESGLPIEVCMTVLLELEMSGYIVQTASHYYARRI